MSGFTFDDRYAESPEEQIDGAGGWDRWPRMAIMHANPEAARLRRARIFHEAAARLGGEMNPARPRVPLAGDAEWTEAEEARQWAACFAWGDREMSYEMARDAQLGVRDER